MFNAVTYLGYGAMLAMAWLLVVNARMRRRSGHRAYVRLSWSVLGVVVAYGVFLLLVGLTGWPFGV